MENITSSRYQLYIGILAFLLVRGYGRNTVIVPGTISVIENTTLRLDCTYSDSITVIPLSCEWTANSVIIALIDPSCSVGNIYPNIYNFECNNATFNTMYIVSTGRSLHSTTFSCSFFVDNSFITGYSTIRIIVPVSEVRMTNPGTNVVTTTENGTVTFICNASAAHPRPNITWFNDSHTSVNFSDDVEITHTVTELFHSDGYLYTIMSNLTFYPTKYDNGSRIYCNASNTERQSISSSRKALLNVYYPPDPPTFFMGSNVSLKEVFVIVNNTLIIRCKSSGNPFPTYIWITSQHKEVLGKDLNIEHIRKSDGGSYSCVAYNKFTTAGETRNHNTSASIEVTVLFPPDAPDIYIIKSGVATEILNSTLQIVIKDDVSIFCNSTGKPHPVSAWNGAESSDTLSLKTIKADMNSTCTSSNVMKETAGETLNGSVSRKLKILVLHPPGTPIIKINMSGEVKEALDVISVIENTDILLECSAESRPDSTFTWSRSMNENIKDVSRQMMMNHIQRNQSGTYTCHAQNVMVRSLGDLEIGRSNRSIHFGVLYPPDTPTFYYNTNGNKHKIKTIQLKVIEGDSLNVLCNASGNPTPIAVWMHNDADTDTLLIVSAEIQHQTNVTCISFNVMKDTFGNSRNGTSSKDLPIIVLYPPRNPVIEIKMKPDSRAEDLNSASVLEGSDVSLYCHAVSNPSPSYKWIDPISSSHMSTSAELLVRNIQRNQSGPYICVVQNKMERSFGMTETGRNSRSIFFDILYKAAIKYFGAANFENNKNIMTVNQSEETRIICKVESNPFSNTTIFFKGRLVNETIRSDTATYNVITSTCSDAGRYICKGKNEYNYDTDASKELFLYVKCLPQPSADQLPEKNVSAALSDSAEFRFHAAPYYDPGITQFRWFKQSNDSRIWLRNGTKTYILSSDINSVLRIIDVSEADYGIYILVYNNSVGMNNFTFYLQQKDQTEERHQGKDKNLPMAVGIVIAVLVIVGITLGLVIYIRRYRQKTDSNNGDRSYDNICGMSTKSGGNNINSESVYEGIKPVHERGFVEMKEQTYDKLKPEDSPAVKDPVYTNLKL